MEEMCGGIKWNPKYWKVVKQQGELFPVVIHQEKERNKMKTIRLVLLAASLAILILKTKETTKKIYALIVDA
jgi:hypothetical protein